MAEQPEATLEDLLNEPIILSVMARDGVRGDDIRRLLWNASTRNRQASGLPVGAAGRPRPDPGISVTV